MAADIVSQVVHLRLGDAAYGVALYRGIPAAETIDLIKTAFRVKPDYQVVGLVDDASGVILPISLLWLNPDLFSSTYELLLLKTSSSSAAVEASESKDEDFSTGVFDADLDMLSMIKHQTKCKS
jgi:hypothetical protein